MAFTKPDPAGDYACTGCGAIVPRDNLSVKKVVFATMGSRGNVFRTRALEWFCDRCLYNDDDYNAPARVSHQERMEVARAKRQAKLAP
ncbi:hypothetical protein SEA_BENCZKOWSKI14_64 [Gordonia phage Benczkowski14]|uniref:Uncharacterized protein n=3 Tax=Demosthenesvirus katyusha TaxID=1982108 RepID=A0A142KCE1_9CAUD|nr:hypothetical protein BH765_gp63 [Gordonia phage Kvothe]YP_009603338.1 hypothetical protein FDH67_gp64 [Gordonia phage Katyusha]AMS03774.1 hypothetical protein SEA_BENCZKOWSKI14_64 [Gordonia phage Benczkowski14]UJD20700.1 hypothetical protein SEA_NIAGARA_64 [Gordonia phage Niagara]AMS03457.1 hypothetical protein SEA_KATYUSHA_64 [Gordonia phage Katyusha]ANA86126.1 hypothetical protein PBI_KVOTHE_63 [Gordonia phage Kvothe]